jgi:ubiquinol-cytochrome c reductase cytochrome c1 subunit
MKNPTIASRPAGTRIAAVIAAAFIAVAAGEASAQEGGHAGPHVERQSWSFAGPFGHYDPAQLQRGFQVYREVCSACHSLHRIAFRNLGEPGGPLFSEAEVKQLASEYQIQDGPNADGEMFERPGRPSDYFPLVYPNDEAARAAQGGALPPDLSLIAKARAVQRGFPWFVLDAVTQYQEAGPDYIYALLTGYQDPPEGVTVADGMHYNPNFVGGNALAMPPPLSDGQVEYSDGAPKTVDQYTRDVAAFLMWAAEPKLDERKQMGFKAMLFMVVFAGLLYFTKRKLWSDVAH